MKRYLPLKIQSVRRLGQATFILSSLWICHLSWAAQEAIVIAEQAVIYSDAQMSAPVGYVRKGKKIKVGDIARNRAQVYPIIVSGKVAYIRVIDVNTEKENADSNTLLAERFQRGTKTEIKSNYSVTGFNYSTQINLNRQNDKLKDKDSVNWTGAGIKGGVEISPHWDLDIMFNYMQATAEEENFRVVEFGMGTTAHIIQTNRFRFNLFAQAMAIPFTSYALGNEFRVNSYGFSAGAGLSVQYRFGKHWGLEANGGPYYTKLVDFNAPTPYNDISPSFIGTRLGVGLNYQY